MSKIIIYIYIFWTYLNILNNITSDKILKFYWLKNYYNFVTKPILDI